MVEITAQFKRATGFSPTVVLATPTQSEAAEEKIFLRYQANLATSAMTGHNKMISFSGQPTKKDWDMIRSICRAEKQNQYALANNTLPQHQMLREAERFFGIMMDDLKPYLSFADISRISAVSRYMRYRFLGSVGIWDLLEPDSMGFCDWSNTLLNAVFTPWALPTIVPPGRYLVVTGRGHWSAPNVLYCPDDVRPGWTARFIEDKWPVAEGKVMAIEAARHARTGIWSNRTLDRHCTFSEFADHKNKYEQVLKEVQGARELDRFARRKYFAQLSHVSGMVRGLAQHGTNIRHLVLSHIPYLNVKLTATIIELLPRLESLTINTCELMHLGTLIPLMDYISWIGWRRDAEFIRLDFFPKAWFGPAKGRESTRVLTWGPTRLNTRQAVMSTVLTAYLKSAEMGYDLLAKGSLLMKYLALIPMDFGLIHVFVRNLKAYIEELQATDPEDRTEADHSRISNIEHQILAALTTGDRYPLQADMVKVVMQERWPCSRCGHVYASPCYEVGMVSRVASQRVCSPCRLTEAIEHEEYHHWMREKHLISDILTSTPADPDFEVPLPYMMIAEMPENAFVAEPLSDHPVWTQHWAAEMPCNARRRLHENSAIWRQAGYIAHVLDAKNRFAEALGMHLDPDYTSNRAPDGESAESKQPKQPVQPFQEHVDPQSWESLYAHNIQTRKVKEEAKERAFW